MTEQSKLIEQLELGVKAQKTTEQQFYVLKTVLNNYPRYTDLGEKALDLCDELYETNMGFSKITDDRDSLFDCISFSLLRLEYLEPEEQEEAEEDGPEPPELEWPIYNEGREELIEDFLEFCSYGVQCQQAIKNVGLSYDPTMRGPH